MQSTTRSSSLRYIVLLAVCSFIFELKYSSGQYMQFEMSSEKIGINSEVRLQSSDTDGEGVDPSQVPTKTKRTFNHFRSWNFLYTIKTDLLGEPGVSIDAKKILLSEHLSTRLGHNRPPAVVFVTVFCDFTFVLAPPQGTSPLISA